MRVIQITGVPSFDFSISNILKYSNDNKNADLLEDMTQHLVLVPEDSSSSINLTTITQH